MAEPPGSRFVRSPQVGVSRRPGHRALREAFGNVCLEASAAGRPVICLNIGGPSLQVTEQCGFKAPVGSLEQALCAMEDAMVLLYRDPDLRLRIGAATRERARTHFHWARKAERINTLYEAASFSG